MYARKTEDEYEVQGYYYPHGWECVTTLTSLKLAKSQVKDYRQNEPGTSFRVVKKRVPIGG